MEEVEAEAASEEKSPSLLSSSPICIAYRLLSRSYVTLKKRRRLIVNQKESAVNHSNEKCPGHDPSLE